MTVYRPPGLRELSEIIDVKHQHRGHIQSARAVVISPVALPMTITGRTCPFSAGTKATVGRGVSPVRGWDLTVLRCLIVFLTSFILSTYF